MGNTVNCSHPDKKRDRLLFFLFILVTYQKLYYPQPGEGLVTITETVSVRVTPSSV